MFVDGFLADRRGFEVELPTVPLGRLYGPELASWLDNHGVRVQTGAGVRRFVVDGDRVTAVELRTGETMAADAIVGAVPFERLGEMLPAAVVETTPYFTNLRHLTHSPITSVHCWFDRPATDLPHVVLVDCLGQWVFNRGPTAEGDHYLQVVVSAARRLEEAGRGETEQQVVAELRSLFSPLREAKLKRVRAITDRVATFSAVPGVDRWRPGRSRRWRASMWRATGPLPAGRRRWRGPSAAAIWRRRRFLGISRRMGLLTRPLLDAAKVVEECLGVASRERRMLSSVDDRCALLWRFGC